MFTFASVPCPHAHTVCVKPPPPSLLTHSSTDQLPAKCWPTYDLPKPRELMSCVSRLCKDYLYLYNSTTQRQLSATNPNSTTHNCNEHRRGCLLPSPIIISLAVTSVTAVNVSYDDDSVTCDRWGAQTAIVLFNYHIPQCWWM